MATNAVVGSALKIIIDAANMPTGKTITTGGVTVAADFYTYGKSDTVVGVANDDFAQHQVAGGDDNLACVVDTSTLSAGNLYAKITVSLTDTDTSKTIKQVSVVDTGVRLINAQ